MKTPGSKQVHHPSCLHMHPNKTKPCIACPCPPSMENTSKSGHTHGDTLTRYTSYTYTGTISTVSIGSSTLPYSNFNNIVFQKKNSIILSYGHWPEVSCNLLLVAALGHCCRLQLSLGHSSSQAPCYYCSRGRAQ